MVSTVNLFANASNFQGNSRSDLITSAVLFRQVMRLFHLVFRQGMRLFHLVCNRERWDMQAIGCKQLEYQLKSVPEDRKRNQSQEGTKPGELLGNILDRHAVQQHNNVTVTWCVHPSQVGWKETR